MNVSVVHIGMLKTATTYMQNVWRNDPNVNLAHGSTMAFLNTTRNNVLNGVDEDISFEFEPDNRINRSPLIISNEGFSTGFINQPKIQSRIPEYIRYNSKQLFLNGSTKNLLITVRDPVSWIRSVYIQAVKQGWSGSAQDFVKNQEEFLLHSLDLRFIVEEYSKYFSNVLIMPHDVLKQDEDLFWEVISDAFDVPYMETRINQKLNKSIDLHRTYLLSKLNEISSCLFETLRTSNTYNNTQEKQRILPAYNQSRTWVNRRFVENASAKEIEEMYEKLNLEVAPETFFAFTLSERLEHSIRENYIRFLKKNILNEFAYEYQRKFEAHVAKY